MNKRKLTNQELEQITGAALPLDGKPLNTCPHNNKVPTGARERIIVTSYGVSIRLSFIVRIAIRKYGLMRNANPIYANLSLLLIYP